MKSITSTAFCFWIAWANLTTDVFPRKKKMSGERAATT
jgi:hypothetical protein